ncbi:hypothetical protein ACQP2P_29110 [Dactylosporangium sp. CA-139114]|uniref:hypothetical protein n=1 Tax=Dactylosporangium sp. CA-139114 TaxID=3239931 RepID=UPI003D9779FD
MIRSRLATAGRAAARTLAVVAAVLQGLDLPDGRAGWVLRLLTVAAPVAAAIDGLRLLGRARDGTVQRRHPTSAQEVPGAAGDAGDTAAAGPDR